METIVTHKGDSYLADYTLYIDIVGLVRCKQPQHNLFNEWLSTDNKHCVKVEEIFEHGEKEFEMLDDGISILYHNVLYPFRVDVEYTNNWKKEEGTTGEWLDELNLDGFEVQRVYWVNEEAEEIRIEITKQIKEHLEQIYYTYERENSERY